MAKSAFNGFTQPRPDRGGTNTGDATAAAADILVTKSAYVRGVKVNGAMPNLSGNWQTGAQHGAYDGGDGGASKGYGVLSQIPLGYSDGGTNTYALCYDTEFMPANIRADQNMFGLQGTMPVKSADNVASAVNGSLTVGRLYMQPTPNSYWPLVGVYTYFDDPDFIAANIRADQNFFGLQGTMPVYSGGVLAGSMGHDSSGSLWFFPSTLGYFGAGSDIYANSPNFLAANIIAGMDMFGLVGTGINAKRSASGSGTGTGSNFTVTGLAFTPSKVIFSARDTAGANYEGFISSTADIYTMASLAATLVNGVYASRSGGGTSVSIVDFGGTVNSSGFTWANLGATATIKWWAFE